MSTEAWAREGRRGGVEGLALVGAVDLSVGSSVVSQAGLRLGTVYADMQEI